VSFIGGSREVTDRGRAIHWVIAGGESGPGARPMHPDWARSLRDQCQAAGVSYFFKQWGAWGPQPVGDWDKKDILWLDDVNVWRVGKKAAGRILDGRTWDEMPNVQPATVPVTVAI